MIRWEEALASRAGIVPPDRAERGGSDQVGATCGFGQSALGEQVAPSWGRLRLFRYG